MADQADVETALVAFISTTLYPSGTSSPSVVNALCSVSRGWPTEAGVADAVSQNGVLIAVHQRAGYSRDATRYQRISQDTQTAPTLTATMAGFVVTFGGTVTAGNTVGVLSAGIAYIHVAAGTETLSSIASALAAVIPGAAAAGAVLTLPSPNALPAVVVVNGGTSSVEVGRQQSGFSIEVWASSPAQRDAVMNYLRPALEYSFRMTLADGTIATLMSFQETGPDDLPSREKMFHRSLMAVFDYPIVYTSTAQAVAAFLTNVTPKNGPTTAIYSV